MKNFVIKAETRERGAKIVAYIESLGIENPNAFIGDTPWWYYGVVNDKFYNSPHIPDCAIVLSDIPEKPKKYCRIKIKDIVNSDLIGVKYPDGERGMILKTNHEYSAIRFTNHITNYWSSESLNEVLCANKAVGRKFYKFESYIDLLEWIVKGLKKNVNKIM